MPRSERRRCADVVAHGEGRKGGGLNSVLSLRVSDEARRLLERTARKRRRSLSRLLRELIEEWATGAQFARGAGTIGPVRRETRNGLASPVQGVVSSALSALQDNP